MVAVHDMLKTYIKQKGDGAQAELARRLDVSQPTMSRWMKGEIIPSEARAAEIADAIGSDEATVLAAISLSRKLRRQAAAAKRLDAAKDDLTRQLEKRVDQLEETVREVLRDFERTIQGLRQELRPVRGDTDAPGGSRKPGRGSR